MTVDYHTENHSGYSLAYAIVFLHRRTNVDLSPLRFQLSPKGLPDFQPADDSCGNLAAATGRKRATSSVQPFAHRSAGFSPSLLLLRVFRPALWPLIYRFYYNTFLHGVLRSILSRIARSPAPAAPRPRGAAPAEAPPEPPVRPGLPVPARPQSGVWVPGQAGAKRGAERTPPPRVPFLKTPHA